MREGEVAGEITRNRGSGLLDRIEGDADGAVSNGVKVQVDAFGVKLEDEVPKPVESEERLAATGALAEVRIEHRGGPNLLYAVEVDLDGLEAQ